MYLFGESMVDLKNDQEREGYGLFHYHYKRIKENPIAIATTNAVKGCEDRYPKPIVDQEKRDYCYLGVDKGREIIKQAESEKKEQQKTIRDRKVKIKSAQIHEQAWR